MTVWLAGERPEESRQLMARSAILLEPGYRSEVARALREALDAAEHARRIFLKAQVRLQGRWRSFGPER